MSYVFGTWSFEEDSLRFKIADLLKKLTAVLLIVWLFKGPLKLEAYNEYIVWGIIALIFAFELMSVGKWFGVTVTGLIFALSKAFFWTALFLFFGKWLGLPETFQGDEAILTASTAFAYAVVLGIAGLLVGKTGFGKMKSKRWFKVEKKAYEFGGVDLGDVKVDGTGKAYPVLVGKKRVGWVIDGEVEVEAETPIGKVRKILHSPVVVWTSQKLAETKVEADPSFVERVQALLNPDKLYKNKESAKVVDLGIIKVYEGDGFQYVKLPFIEVIETPHGERVKVGPIRVHEGSVVSPLEDMVTIRELGNGFQLTKAGDRLAIQTDEYTIEVAGNKVTYRSGNEVLKLSKDYVSLKSGEISITVGKNRAKLRIDDTIISASDGKVRIRVGGKSYTIENKGACNLVIRKAKDIIEEQSVELIEGLGINRAALNRRVKELIDELMEHLG
ncbi:hypothetical membrane protein, conserved [Thermococcus onnurineus NA1]|uniref:Hypothetical membrane protein, conserved n=1 Tax=Thermococcus onnurineus (strain NA1) TaxID=523850 RepID=B6YUT1_THEON|nr:hypothetical protein [Thermococcus onnurineus]ACJ16117.1 hypothetical membrane protein, conserved [Thermococcus onnurineus NA1]